jgi:phenylalanyl-tRNA synthetase beta chain
LRYYDAFAIFEAAQVITSRSFVSEYDAAEAIPLHRRNVAGGIVTDGGSVTDGFRKLKGVLEALPAYVHAETFTLEQRTRPVWADEFAWLNIVFEGEIIGNLALLSSKVAGEVKILNKGIFIFELDIDSLKPYSSRTNKFSKIQRYQSNECDLSLMFDVSVRWAEIKSIAESVESARGLLQSVTFIDEYQGGNISTGKKSISFRLRIASDEKTLTSAEIREVENSVRQSLVNAFSATSR